TAIVLLKLPVVAHAFGTINDAVGAISAASRAGSSFVFGYVGGGPLPFDVKVPGADFILAFQALPIVLVMSVLTTLLFYWRVLPPIVRGIASVLGAPAAILVSLIMVPETSDKRTGGALEDPEMEVSSTMDAIVKGTGAGIELLINIVAMLLVLVALVYLVNAILGLLPHI